MKCCSLFWKEKDYLVITLKFHESVVDLRPEKQVVAGNVATDFNIHDHSKGLFTARE
jgi:hypothetical protein